MKYVYVVFILMIVLVRAVLAVLKFECKVKGIWF